jgi:hypothetical protein
MTILKEVNEIEGKVVDTVRSIQRPVVDYVRKGVDLAEGLLPTLPKATYLQNLPDPAEVVSSQIDFAKALLDAQRDFVTEIIEAVSPLVMGSAEQVPVEEAPKPTVAAEPEPAPKTSAAPAAKPAAKRSTTRSTTRKTTRSPKA